MNFGPKGLVRTGGGGRPWPAGRVPARYFVALLMVVPAALLTGCADRVDGARQSPVVVANPAPADPAPEAGRATAEPSTAVAVPMAPAETPGPLTIDTNLVVDQDVTLMARMSGIVEEILVDRGARVKKGDILLRLVNLDLRLLLQRAGIAARQKRAEFERARRLSDTLSDAQFDEVKFALEAADNEVEIAQEELDKSLIRAPFDGLIIDRFARIGQRVVEDRNEPLFRLTALSPLQARLYVPEGVARSLRQGDPVEVRPRYQKGVSVTGTIAWISRVIDASSGTRQAIISVRGGGRQGSLEPGSTVTVVFGLDSANTGALIPPAALEGRSSKRAIP
jgi:RND family efflux transporter MFP subunit